MSVPSNSSFDRGSRPPSVNATKRGNSIQVPGVVGGGSADKQATVKNDPLHIGDTILLFSQEGNGYVYANISWLERTNALHFCFYWNKAWQLNIFLLIFPIMSALNPSLLVVDLNISLFHESILACFDSPYLSSGSLAA